MFGTKSKKTHMAGYQAWYVVQTKPNAEAMAFRNLENQDFSSFLPLQKLTLRKGTAFKTLLRPLFPGYMFIAQDPTAGQWRKINNTPENPIRTAIHRRQPTVSPKIGAESAIIISG